MLQYWVASKNEVLQKTETGSQYQELVLDIGDCEDYLDFRKREEQNILPALLAVMNELFGLVFSTLFCPYGEKFLSGAKILWLKFSAF